MSWTIDYAHSEIQFIARHMMITKVHGEFEKFTGSITLDENKPANTTVAVQVETASINTRDPKRDGHLRSPDFFSSEKYPLMTFKSKRVDVLDKSHARLTGDLTIREITRELTLDVEYLGLVKNLIGSLTAGFTATGKINRKNWDLNWNIALETGGLLVGDEIDINIELELIQQTEKESVAQK